MVTEAVNVTTKITSQTEAPSGEGIVAVVAPLDALATVSANVAKRYYRSADAETDHGAGSLAAVGVATVNANGARPPIAAAAGQRSGSPFTETLGASGGGGAITTGTLNAARMPIRKADVSAASRDGTNILAGVKFTTEDPTTLTPGAAEVYINPKTGAFKLGTATSGAGAGFVITYKAYDWEKALDALDAFGEFEMVAIAGLPLTADNYGVYDKVSSWCSSKRKLLVGAMGSAVKPADINATDFKVTALSGDHIYLIAANGYTGDLVSAMAARLAREPANATTKDQAAPLQSVSFTDYYQRADFGNDVSPDATTTFHGLGVNAVYRDRSGTARISSARARIGYSDNAKFIFRRRVVNAVAKGLDNRLRAFRQSTSTDIPFDANGIAGVRSQIGSELAEYIRRGWIATNPTITIPPLAEIPAGEIGNAVLNDIQVAVRLPGQMHVFEILLDASLA